jgi:hypothetical protein
MLRMQALCSDKSASSGTIQRPQLSPERVHTTQVHFLFSGTLPLCCCTSLHSSHFRRSGVLAYQCCPACRYWRMMALLALRGRRVRERLFGPGASGRALDARCDAQRSSNIYSTADVFPGMRSVFAEDRVWESIGQHPRSVSFLVFMGRNERPDSDKARRPNFFLLFCGAGLLGAGGMEFSDPLCGGEWFFTELKGVKRDQTRNLYDLLSLAKTG